MLSYRHGFHAGNFADVFKHVALVLLLDHLKRKDKGFAYLDTHAGAGRYDLRGEMARKTGEAATGIFKLWNASEVPAIVTTYLDIIRALNGGNGMPRWYPGSPLIARALLRPQDRMLLAELHPADAPLLDLEFRGDKQVQVRREDGYHMLKAKLPPHERRGMVLIDPAYELRDEPVRIVRGVQEACQRWATGIYAIWYPIMPKVPARKLHEALAATGLRKILMAEFCLFPRDNPLGMNGSGMIVINPPWQFDTEIAALMTWLRQQMDPGNQGESIVRWLVPE